MARNSVCVIYDSDEDYAKKLMNVINSDGEIPYNAKVFTKEAEFKRYMQDGVADVLMINEDSFRYEIEKTHKGKVVVLCEDESEADAINKNHGGDGESVIGVCKYQPSYQLIQSVVKYHSKGDNYLDMGSKFIGVYGMEESKRVMLSLILATVLSENSSVLYISLSEFSGIDSVLHCDGKSTLSDALYCFKQNHLQYHKGIADTIHKIGKLEYIPPVSCAEDISYMSTGDIVAFIQSLGRQMGYSYVVIDIGGGIRSPWEICRFCDRVFVPAVSDYFGRQKLMSVKKYLYETGMSDVADNMIMIDCDVESEYMNEDFMNRIVYSKTFEKVREALYG